METNGNEPQKKNPTDTFTFTNEERDLWKKLLLKASREALDSTSVLPIDDLPDSVLLQVTSRLVETVVADCLDQRDQDRAKIWADEYSQLCETTLERIEHHFDIGTDPSFH